MAGSVHHQLITSFVLFALTLGGSFAAVTLLVFHRVEDRMVQRRLQQMLDARPGDREPVSLHFVGAPTAAPPPFAERLANTEAGFYEWEEKDDRETHALLVVDPASGERTVALAQFTESESSQSRFAFALLIGVGASSLLALLLARHLVARIVSPVERLTARLTSGSLDEAVPADLASELRDDEIGLLARSLQHAGERLTAAAERERRFLREASHELRTPITVIQGVSDLLQESIDTGDSVNRKRLERLDRGLRRMHTSVLSLLAMARAEHRLAASEMAPFRQQLDDLVEEARTLACPGVDVRAEVTGEPTSNLAASMLIVALSNLVRNAVQNCDSGTVTVTVDADRAVVRDRGPGLPARLLEQLRSPGPQPDIGIGLATVQRVCRRFGWSFEVDCPVDGGTVAVIGFQPEMLDSPAS